MRFGMGMLASIGAALFGGRKTGAIAPSVPGKSRVRISKAVAEARKRFKRLAEIREKHAAHNRGVKTRQVLRRRGFQQAFADVTLQYGGELRCKRRKIARARVHRIWSGVAA